MYKRQRFHCECTGIVDGCDPVRFEKSAGLQFSLTPLSLIHISNWIGQPGKEVSISRNEIRRVRFLKSTVMYRVGRSDGGIALEMKNGRTVFISSVLHGENIFDALR